jgi:hypothetical protein
MRQHFANPRISLVPLSQPATTTAWILAHWGAVLPAKMELLAVED